VQKPIDIGGVWVTTFPSERKFAVCVQVDGQWRQLGVWPTEGSLVSHIIEPLGIMRAPRVDVPRVRTKAPLSNRR